MPSESEHRYTSTGRKFWRHPEQMASYREGTGRTVISTHIAPEGACNLKCPYCSVTHRDTHSRLKFETIIEYVEKLRSRGLKAVILTGGGEPLAYHELNELVNYLRWTKLKVALITNGTLTHKLRPEYWDAFEWIRVSVNFFPGWEEKIKLPLEHILATTTIGLSMVFTKGHESKIPTNPFRQVAKLADRLGAKYIRVLPDCLLPQDKLEEAHALLEKEMAKGVCVRFFHQQKNHRAPDCDTCHQSYFRPYLSEVGGGAVFPCDSVVLNDSVAEFTEKYKLCDPGDILDYLDGKIKAPFNPREDCSGCVFTDTVEMLGEWKEPMKHEEFV